MSLWIKICGNTSFEDAVLAAETGADAVGFVFATSPRQITPEQVSAIVPRLPSGLEKIGVFVNSTIDEIVAVIRTCHLTGVQLHFDTGSDLPAKLRDEFGPDLRILRVLHFGAVLEKRIVLAQDKIVDAILVDSRTATAVGGTGVAFDWKAAASLFEIYSPGCKLVVAGGLTPANVSEAIATLHPWGVDVVSGVESSRGHKDSAKIRTFIANARAAVSNARPA